MKRYVLAIPALALMGACSGTGSPVQPRSPNLTSASGAAPVVASRSAPFAGTTSGGTTVVLDFESLAASGTGFTFVPSYSQNGFTIVDPANSGSDAFGAPQSGNPYYQGSTALVNNTPNDVTELTKDDGGTFSAVSIDIAELSPSDLTPRQVPFSGTRVDGSIVTATLTTDSIAGFQTYTFPAGFTDLVSLSWTQIAPFHQFDNIVLDPVAAGPRTKADCWNGGWKAFGFINQGQCIRMVETGTDTR